MATNIEMISKEMIKPSSPTPTHLKTFRLSGLDQIAPRVYIPLIFFYHHHQLISNPQQTSQLLKKSLSKILTTFYPLGGVVEENATVECDDSGAEFSEARVGTRVSDVIQGANMEEIKKLLPVESLVQDENIVLKVRINFFDCGGIAVAVCLSHKIADATSAVEFMKAWAATCHGENKIIFNPIFDFASFFPPRPLSQTQLDFFQKAHIMTRDKIATKRLVFSQEKIVELKEFNAGSTRVGAVSSYIWRRFIEVAKEKAKVKASSQTQKSLFLATLAVNLRPRKMPPFPQQMFGNCYRSVHAISTPEDDYSELWVKLRDAIASMDDDYIKYMGREEYVEDQRRRIELSTRVEAEICSFTSWCRFPTYEVDFGWGKPLWVCTTLPAKNVVILMSTPCGEGIEAWVSVPQEDMLLFEHI